MANLQSQVRFLTAWMVSDEKAKTIATIDRQTDRTNSESVAASLVAKGYIKADKGSKYSITKNGVKVLDRHSAQVNRMLNGTL